MDHLTVPRIKTNLVKCLSTVSENPYQVWVPQESYLKFQYFIMKNRGDLSVLVHPLGENYLDDHESHSLFLGDRFLLNTDPSNTAMEPAQYPELGMGYNA